MSLYLDKTSFVGPPDYIYLAMNAIKDQKGQQVVVIERPAIYDLVELFHWRQPDDQSETRRAGG